MKTPGLKPWAALCGAVLLATGSLFAEDALTIIAPLEHQVVQRTQQDRADVPIAGVAPAVADQIEAKAELGEEAARGKSIDWTVIAKGPAIAEGAFSGTLSLDAGGWYVISVRALRGKEVIASAKVEKVGIGDVFITAGQSNSANFGKPRQAAKDDRVVYFNGKGFVPAWDPIPGGCGGGGSPWPILGDHIVQSQRIPVCFRSASLTWTQVKNWLPPQTRLYKNLVTCVGEFGKNGARAVLWHQGESDSLAKTSAETYSDRLKTIIETLNTDAGYDLPWFVAQASFHPGSKPSAEAQVAKGQQLLWQKGIAHKGAVTDDLGQKYRSDKVHFNQLGLTTHAQRWFEALATAYQWIPQPEWGLPVNGLQLGVEPPRKAVRFTPGKGWGTCPSFRVHLKNTSNAALLWSDYPFAWSALFIGPNAEKLKPDLVTPIPPPELNPLMSLKPGAEAVIEIPLVWYDQWQKSRVPQGTCQVVISYSPNDLKKISVGDQRIYDIPELWQGVVRTPKFPLEVKHGP